MQCCLCKTALCLHNQVTRLCGTLHRVKTNLCRSALCLRCIAWHCIALHCIALRCVALRCVTSNCMALHCMAGFNWVQQQKERLQSRCLGPVCFFTVLTEHKSVARQREANCCCCWCCWALLLVVLALVQQAPMSIVQITAACKNQGVAPVAGQQAVAVAVVCGALWSTLSGWGKRNTQMEGMGRAIRRGRKGLTLWMCWSTAPQTPSLGLDPSGRECTNQACDCIRNLSCIFS